MHESIYVLGVRPYPPLVALALCTFPQPISDQPVALGFPHRVGSINPRERLLLPRVVGVVHAWKGF